MAGNAWWPADALAAFVAVVRAKKFVWKICESSAALTTSYICSPRAARPSMHICPAWQTLSRLPSRSRVHAHGRTHHNIPPGRGHPNKHHSSAHNLAQMQKYYFDRTQSERARARASARNVGHGGWPTRTRGGSNGGGAKLRKTESSAKCVSAAVCWRPAAARAGQSFIFDSNGSFTRAFTLITRPRRCQCCTDSCTERRFHFNRFVNVLGAFKCIRHVHVRFVLGRGRIFTDAECVNVWD